MKIYNKVKVNFKKAYIQPYSFYLLIIFLLTSLIINVYMYVICTCIINEVVNNTENLGNITKEVIDNYDSLNVNRNMVEQKKVYLFGYPIELFNKSNSKYTYFPSYFIDNSIKISSCSYFPERLPVEKLNIVNNLSMYQNYMIEYYNSNYRSLLYDLHDIIVEYIDITPIATH
jgi:hypothetical protein